MASYCKPLSENCLLLQCKIYSFGGMIADLCWVEQVASSMASHMLVTCPTSFERSHLLRLLSEEHFGEEFKCSGKQLDLTEWSSGAWDNSRISMEAQSSNCCPPNSSPGTISLA